MAVVAALGTMLTTGTAAAAPLHRAGGGSAPAPRSGKLSYVKEWEQEVPAQISLSSPIPDTFDHVPAVVVGAANGHIYAFGLAHGHQIKGWPATTPQSIPVDSTPSVNGSLVYVGVGTAGAPEGGGYLAINANGTNKWWRQIALYPSSSTMSGVQASMAVGILNHVKSVVAGSLGQQLDELQASNGAIRPGFPWLSSDTEFSTPSIANIYGNGRNYIIGGAEQTGGTSYKQGGHLRVLDGSGNAGTGTPTGGVNCDFTPNQGVQSSPAVGRFLGGNKIGIVVGTGNDFKGASDTDKLFGLNPHCGLVWATTLNGLTTDSPALVDALGNNRLEVAEGTSTGSNSGTAYLIDGATGRPYWSTNLPGQVIGSITSANLGGGHQDLLVPTTNGLFVLNGTDGRQLLELGKSIGLQSSAVVTDDADGRIGITIAGYNDGGGVAAHFEIPGTKGSLADEAGAWPMFHHDPQLTGTTLPRLR